MNASELRTKSIPELKAEILTLMTEQFNLRTQRSIGQLNHTHHFRRLKKGIARINTVLSEKEGSTL